MEYISLINGFNRWLETNPLDPMAQLLMFKFFDIFNRSGWEEWVSVDNLTLMSKIKIGRESTLISIRDKLVECGLVEYRKGKKGSPNKYKLTFKTVVKSEVQTAVQTAVKSEVKNEVQTADIIRQRQRQRQRLRQNIKNTPSLSPSREENQEIDPLITLPLNDQSLYPLYPQDVEEWSELYPAVDVMQQLRSMRGWLEANPTKRKTQSSIQRFINGWLAREQDKGGNSYDSGNNSSHGISGQTGENSGGITLRIPNVW